MEQLSSFTFERSIKGDYKKARILVDGLQFRYICFVYSFILFKSTMLIFPFFSLKTSAVWILHLLLLGSLHPDPGYVMNEIQIRDEHHFKKSYKHVIGKK
jgi:hypothetical protein